MRETWYVLGGGIPADPNECAPDAAGVMRHKNGAAVAHGPYGLISRSMSQDEIAAARRASPRALDREMKPAPAARYKTR